MSDSFEMQVIARIRSDFGSKFGVPRQSGLVPQLQARMAAAQAAPMAFRFFFFISFYRL